VDAADPGTDQDTRPSSVRPVCTKIASRVLHGLPCGRQGKEAEGIVPPHRAPSQTPLGIEAFDLGSDLCVKTRGIESSDSIDTAAPSEKPLPGRLYIVSQGRDRAQTGDHNTFSHKHTSLCEII
jgi:hypothetical protein